MLGTAALVAGILAERQLASVRAGAPDSTISGPTRLYALAIVLMLLAWAGGGTTRGLPVRARGAGARLRRGQGTKALRIALGLGATGLSLFSTARLRAADFEGPWAWGWLAGVLILLGASVGHRFEGLSAPRTASSRDRRGWLDALSILLLLAVAIAFRFHRLGDWAAGLHGDEGEVGLDALSAVEKGFPAAFQHGFGDQLHLYTWGVAAGMKLFGTGLLGLKAFSAFVGALTVIPLYGLARLWFGRRAALLCGGFLAVSEGAVHYSRIEFSNSTNPLFLALGFYLLFRALLSGHALDWVLTGYSFMGAVLFYQGGRLSPFLLAGTLGFALVARPLALGALAGRKGRRATLRRELARAWRYVVPVSVLVLASICLVAPFAARAADAWAQFNERAKEKMVFGSPGLMAQQYDADHQPLLLHLLLPVPTHGPTAPPGSEPVSPFVTLTSDGFWPRVLWGQLTIVLSMFTLRGDGSMVFDAAVPITTPPETLFLILGLAWSIYRFRDVRFSCLSIWFWATVVAGGVLTINQPYLPRLVGFLPAVALLTGSALDRWCAELARLGRRLGFPRSAAAIALLLGLATVAAAGSWSFARYFDGFIGSRPFRDNTGLSRFVRETNEAMAREGRPPARFLNFGGALWTYGVNAFLNVDARGKDAENVADDLPVAIVGNGDLLFLVWEPHRPYLEVLRRLYPVRSEGDYSYGGHLFRWVRVKSEDLSALRSVEATYRGADGRQTRRREDLLVRGGAPPGGLVYPVTATYVSGLLVPAGGVEGAFRLEGGAGRLDVGGQSFPLGPDETAFRLSRGLHPIRLDLVVPVPGRAPRLLFRSGDGPFGTVPRRLLFSGAVPAVWHGEVGLAALDWADARPGQALSGPDPVGSRTDWFLSFRNGAALLGADVLRVSGVAGTVVDWAADVDVTKGGTYTFELESSGGSFLRVDGALALDNRDSGSQARSCVSQVELFPGRHRLELRHHVTGWPGTLELFVTPPGGERGLVPWPEESVGQAR